MSGFYILFAVAFLADGEIAVSLVSDKLAPMSASECNRKKLTMANALNTKPEFHSYLVTCVRVARVSA